MGPQNTSLTLWGQPRSGWVDIWKRDTSEYSEEHTDGREMVAEGAGTTLHPSLPGQILEVGAEQWSMWAAEIWAQWQPVMGASLSFKGRALYLTPVCRNGYCADHPNRELSQLE